MASSGPAMKPSSDMVTCQITLLKALRPLDQLNEDTARRLEVLRVDIGYESPRNRAYLFPDPRLDFRALFGQLGGARAAGGGARYEPLAFEFLQQLGDLGPVHSELARAGEELAELAGVLEPSSLGEDQQRDVLVPGQVRAAQGPFEQSGQCSLGLAEVLADRNGCVSLGHRI